MLNAVSVHHPVLSLARCCLLPALACRCHPPSLPSVAVAVSHRCLSLPQSSSPIHCLCCLLSLSLVAVISHRRRQMPSSCQQIILPVAVISCAISCLLPPLFFVGGRHPHHLSSTITVPLVTTANACEQQCPVSTTVTLVRHCCPLLSETVITSACLPQTQPPPC